MSKENILDELTKILVETFEIEGSEITLSSNLYEDLDLDSIDAIDLVVKVQEVKGLRIKPEEFKSARTVEDVVNIIDGLERG